jgi:integrase
MPVAEFIETVYLPEIEETKRASTTHDYKDVFRIHLKGRLAEISLRDFRTCDAEELLKTIARQARTKQGDPLRHATLQRIKSFMSGAFTVARRKGVLDTPNPMVNVSVPAGTPAGITYAYSLPEIWAMLVVLPEPARTIVYTVAFTGMRQGELRGLRWKNFDGQTLRVERSVWKKGIINPPKGKASGAPPIPVVKVLQDALEAHKRSMGALADPDLPIFQSGIGTPLSLSNLAKRVIIPRIEKCSKCGKSKAQHPVEGHLFALDPTLCWHGWHAFRRGLGTNLHALGVADLDIQAILRHSHISVTQACYIKSLSEVQVNALDLLAEKLADEASWTGYAPKSKESIN